MMMVIYSMRHETGTGQQVAQLHDRQMMMMMIYSTVYVATLSVLQDIQCLILWPMNNGEWLGMKVVCLPVAISKHKYQNIENDNCAWKNSVAVRSKT
jgi:hypothetical protein